MSFHKIIQGHYGFIWCASSNGLYRFDGREFRQFKKYAAHSPPVSSDFIWDILEDEQHDIWLATYDGGINRWNRRTGKFDYFRRQAGAPNSLASDNVLYMTMAKDGMLWAAVELENGVPVLEKLDPVSRKVRHYRHQPGNALSLASDTISITAVAGSPLKPMIQDKEGRLWVATRGGLNLYVPASDGFRTIPGPWARRREQIIHLYESPAVPGLIWVLAAAEGLASGHAYRLDGRSLQATPLDFPLDELLSYAPTGIYHPPGKPDELWLSSRELCRLSLKDGTSKIYTPALKADRSLWQGLRDSLFLLQPGPSGLLWLLPMSFSPVGHARGSEKYYIRNGIFQMNSQSGQLELLENNPAHPAASFGMAYSISCSPDGHAWIGCYPGFYQYLGNGSGEGCPPVFKDIPLWAPPAGPDKLSAWAAIERPAGVLWVATFKGGVKRVNVNSGDISHFRHEEGNPASVADDKVYALFADEQAGRLWIGTDKGLDWVALAELDEEYPSPIFHHLRADRRLAGREVTSISRGPDGRLWIGAASEGLLLLNTSSGLAEGQFRAGTGEDGNLNSSYINKVFTDSRERTWVATGMGGLCQAFPDSTQEKGYSFHCRLEGMYIVDIFENADGKLWLAAMNYGITIFDPETGNYELWNMENRLIRNSALGIEQDARGRIWFSSLGLSRYDPGLDALRHFRKADGIQDEDPGRLLLTLRDGRMAYSSINGWLQVFDPNTSLNNPAPPRVAITALKAYSQKEKNMAEVAMEENIEVTAEIRLQYGQQPFQFSFAGLEFAAPEGIRYASMLDGYETQWNVAREQESNRYINVPPGAYNFLLRAANIDGLWMEAPARLRVIILPPWWRTGQACLAYLLLFAGAIYAIALSQRRRGRLQAQLKFQQQEAARLKEMDAIKTKLYTEIAHELRTPLSVIEGMAGSIREAPQRWLGKGLEMIQRNTRQLLRLTNQLLELSMVESGALKINMIQGEVMGFLRANLEPFSTLAAQKGVHLHTQLLPERMLMDYDPDKLQSILSNLLSNALKFTPEGGTVQVKCLREEGGLPILLITVEDTGRGIPEEDLPHVFERWFRGGRQEEGAGIGLALTRELVRLLGGSIEARNRLEGGACFSVWLPIRQQASPAETLAAPPAREAAPTPGRLPKDARPRLLIVEDNAGLRTYLATLLDKSYELSFARNGKEGLEKAVREAPLMVISDIMMPEMDGLELCRRLKGNLSTSHIPVLLLTARADRPTRIQGLDTGADAYLSKPFNREELPAQIRQLLENRQRLQQYYRAILTEAPRLPSPATKADLESLFLIRAREAALAKISDPDFGVKGLCQALRMSRTQLHNKIHALTGQSTSRLIRNIRLQYARQALEQNPGLSVADAAYSAGFKDPNYFSRCFKKEFGISPKGLR